MYIYTHIFIYIYIFPIQPIFVLSIPSDRMTFILSDGMGSRNLAVLSNVPFPRPHKPWQSSYHVCTSAICSLTPDLVIRTCMGIILLSLSLSLYIYIYREREKERKKERERERDICIYIYIYMSAPV